MKRYVTASGEEMGHIAFSADYLTRASVARTTNSTDLLSVYAYDPNFSVRLATVENRNTPSDLLFDMAKTAGASSSELGSNENKLLGEIADHPNASPECLEYIFNIALANNGPVYTLAAIADNPNTPAELLTRLAEVDFDSQTWRIRAVVTGNPNTPTDLLYSLAEDNGKTVRYLAKQELKHRGETL